MVVKDFFYFKNHCAAAIEIQPLLKFKNIFLIAVGNALLLR